MRWTFAEGGGGELVEVEVLVWKGNARRERRVADEGGFGLVVEDIVLGRFDLSMPACCDKA